MRLNFNAKLVPSFKSGNICAIYLNGIKASLLLSKEEIHLLFNLLKNNKMKKLAIMLVVCLSTIGLTVQAQGGGQRMSIEERQAQELKALTKAVDLDTAQVSAVKVLQAKMAEDSESMRSTMSKNDRQAMREAMEELRETYDKDVRALLTEEQLPKYEEYLEKREEAMSQRQGQRPGQGQGEGQSRKRK